MIVFQCPSCGKRYQVDDGHGGRKTTCRSCQTKMRVPAAAGSIAPPAPPGLPDYVADMIAEQRPQIKRCPFCESEISASAKKCKHCGETVDVSLRVAEAGKWQTSRSEEVQQQGAIHQEGGYDGPCRPEFPYLIFKRLLTPVVGVLLGVVLWYSLDLIEGIFAKRRIAQQVKRTFNEVKQLPGRNW